MAKSKVQDFDNAAHNERQEELAAQFRDVLPPNMTKEQRAAEAEWKENHAAQQRAAYPHIYRDADERAARDDYQPARDPEVSYAERYPVLQSFEPGHDPSIQDRPADDETAGADNRPPHETTPATPNPAGTATK